MWAWVLLPFEVALGVMAFYFYRKTKQTSDMMHAAQAAWQTEVEAHLRSLVHELETLLDKADAQGLTRQARWFPTAGPTPAPVAASAEAAEAAAVTPAHTFEHILEDTLAEAGEPTPVAVAPVAPPVATDDEEDPRYREARRLHAAGFDAVAIARKVGLEREEVQMLLQWSPAAHGHGHPDGGAPREAAERRIASLVEYLRVTEGAQSRRKTGAASPRRPHGTESGLAIGGRKQEAGA